MGSSRVFKCFQSILTIVLVSYLIAGSMFSLEGLLRLFVSALKLHKALKPFNVRFHQVLQVISFSNMNPVGACFCCAILS